MSTQDGTVDLEREHARARVAGWVGLAAVVVTFAALVLEARGSRVERSPGGGAQRAEQLMDLHDKASWQFAAVSARAVGLVLAVFFGLFLYDAVRGRSPEIPKFTRPLGVIGPLLVAAATVVGLLALKHVADEFVASGQRLESRADHLVKHDHAVLATVVFERVAFLSFGIWLTILSLMAMRVGLLTRFLGIFGIGAGIASTLLPIGNALFMGWLASVSVMALGWWPGGRPRAWDEGRAVPWTVGDAP